MSTGSARDKHLHGYCAICIQLALLLIDNCLYEALMHHDVVTVSVKLEAPWSCAVPHLQSPRVPIFSVLHGPVRHAPVYALCVSLHCA